MQFVQPHTGRPVARWEGSTFLAAPAGHTRQIFDTRQGDVSRCGLLHEAVYVKVKGLFHFGVFSGVLILASFSTNYLSCQLFQLSWTAINLPCSHFNVLYIIINLSCNHFNQLGIVMHLSCSHYSLSCIHFDVS
jgi:hypothetical protein